MHGVPDDLAAESTHAIVGRRDRLFPATFQRRVLRERLGLQPIEVDAGHLPALSKPAELARIVLDISGG